MTITWPREIDLQAPTITGRDDAGGAWVIRKTRGEPDAWAAQGPADYIRSRGRPRLYETALQAMAAAERAARGY